jgi:hypothetical protein
VKDNEDTSFLQGVEGRLDSLVGGETQKKDEGTDQSKVISEIEKSFNAIFGDNNKEVKAEVSENNSVDEVQFIPPSVEEIIFKAEQADIQSNKRTQPELVPPDSVSYSPLKDIKSIIHSLEWEISKATLDQLDAEINKLQALNEGNSTILGFLQILRFLGRYIRVKGPDFNHAAIALLLSVYDNMEDVILSEDMTIENKHAMLLEDIRKYREWADEIDFDVSKEISPDKQTIPATSEFNYHVPNVIAAIRHMTPHEAIAYVIEDFKIAISLEINALRLEIQRYNLPK